MRTVAELRLQNTYLLLEEFKAAEGPSERLLRAADQAFAEYLQISPSHWSQLKGGHRTVRSAIRSQDSSKRGAASLSGGSTSLTIPFNLASRPPSLHRLAHAPRTSGSQS